MFRSSRNIVLTLLGSAAMFGCCCTSCAGWADEPVRDANGNEARDNTGHIVRHRHYFLTPWHSFGFYGGSSYWHSSSPGFRSGVGRVGGRSGSTAGSTNRGGFGRSGHAVGS